MSPKVDASFCGLSCSVAIKLLFRQKEGLYSACTSDRPCMACSLFAVFVSGSPA